MDKKWPCQMCVFYRSDKEGQGMAGEGRERRKRGFRNQRRKKKKGGFIGRRRERRYVGREGREEAENRNRVTMN